MKSSAQSTRVKPPALRPGDKIGIVAPASNIKRDALDRGCEALRRLGYKPIYSESILERDLYFAGSVKRRAQELEEMFVRDDVRAIIRRQRAEPSTDGSRLALTELRQRHVDVANVDVDHRLAGFDGGFACDVAGGFSVSHDVK